jgi:hypothetical protein
MPQILFAAKKHPSFAVLLWRAGKRRKKSLTTKNAEIAKPANPFPQKGTKGTKFENRLLRLLLLSCSLHRAKLAP